MGKLTDSELLRLRESGKSARELAELDGCTHSSILRRLKRLDRESKGPQDADGLKREIIAGIDPKKLTESQKLSALRTLSKSRKRTARRGDLDVEFQKYWESLSARTGVDSPTNEEEAKRFFTQVMTNKWKQPDLSPYESVLCPKCRTYYGCRKYPVCVRCSDDVPFDHANNGRVGHLIHYILCEECRENNATSRRGNPGNKALCNKCRLALQPPKEVSSET